MFFPPIDLLHDLLRKYASYLFFLVQWRRTKNVSTPTVWPISSPTCYKRKYKVYSQHVNIVLVINAVFWCRSVVNVQVAPVSSDDGGEVSSVNGPWQSCSLLSYIDRARTCLVRLVPSIINVPPPLFPTLIALMAVDPKTCNSHWVLLFH